MFKLNYFVYIYLLDKQLRQRICTHHYKGQQQKLKKGHLFSPKITADICPFSALSLFCKRQKPLQASKKLFSEIEAPPAFCCFHQLFLKQYLIQNVHQKNVDGNTTSEQDIFTYQNHATDRDNANKGLRGEIRKKNNEQRAREIKMD